ncbi:MAG: putative RND superfamily exporter protein [Candidatus Azotimanducaceae bacterium]|jgi:predicted RND superfamily exporter protein
MLASKIVPIIDFGWMMCLGIVTALIVTYVLFPTLLLILGPAKGSSTIGAPIKITGWFQHLATKRTNQVIAVALVSFFVGLLGAWQLNFDNRFVDYFSDDTDIRKGMEQIDRHLGGTLPLDIYVRFEQMEIIEDDFFGVEDDPFPERYSYTPNKIQLLRDVQTHLERRPEIGKVLSLASVEQLARNYNDGEPLSAVELSFLLGQLPSEIRKFLIEPFANPSSGWMRINARITESEVLFSKEILISDIRQFLVSKTMFAEDEIIVTGMVVLFTDMLQQLADSQLRTLGYVLGATFIIFVLLLRSLKLALIGLIPNMLAALLILAVIGYAGIPMDMMTVTIATICIGIGVDDAIHYLHRFEQELRVADSA